jgi:hypothetical protein
LATSELLPTATNLTKLDTPELLRADEPDRGAARAGIAAH